MNKGNLNKLVTNYPVELTEEEISNLSGTLAPVIAACGGGGGGGTPIYYYGDDVNINISPARVIRLTDAATAKLNRDIPTKVSDLTDSANYQTVAGMDQYLTELEAQSTYLTKSSADNDYAPLSTIADVEALKAASGDFSEYYKKTETSSKTELETEFAKYATTGEVDAIETDLETLSSTVTSQYATIRYVQDSVYDLATKSDLNKKQNKLVYDYDETGAISSIDGTPLAGQGGKTYSAGQYINIDSNDTISVTGLLALDEYAQYEPVLIGDANITATSSKVNSHTQWNLAINATPVVTNTKLTGQNCVTAHTTETSGEWAVGLVQSAYQAIDSVGGIATDVGTLKTASGNWDKVSDKLDTTAFSDVSGTFLTKSSADNDYAPKSVTATVNTLTGASASWNEVSAKLGTAQYATDSATFLKQNDLDDYYQKTETSSKDELSDEFAKYVTSSNVTTQDTDYVMTTTGWKVLTLPGGGMTQVIHDETLTGQGNDANSKLGVAWSALSGNTINSALSAGSATSALSAENAESARYTKQLKDASKTIQISDITALQNWASSNSSTWDAVSAKLGTAQYALDSGTFVTSSNSTITGTKQYALTTAGWSDIGLSNYLPLSGGTVTGEVIVKSSGKNLLAVNTDATLMGQSRVANLTDTTAIGTNWMGVNTYGGGFLKNVQGGNVGDLDGTSIQINFSPNGSTAYGNITVNSQGNESKVVHIPTASYNSMSSFDNTNGPNYMLRKTASGFDIGAAVINVTQLPATTEANAYYFVYDA